MQENQINIQRYEEDEIDLRELFKTLMDNKMMIIIITFLVTMVAIIYVFIKNPVPVYTGKVMVEVGVGVGVESIPNQVYFDNPINLKSIIEQKFSASVDTPKRTNNILLISSSNINKDKIKATLKDIVSYVMEKHTEKLKLYDKYIMTKQIGDIKISDTPINKVNKKLIVTVAFVTGLILSIFIVFFLEFIRGFKEEEKV